eukprot:1071318-Amphidinium_carterae.1
MLWFQNCIDNCVTSNVQLNKMKYIEQRLTTTLCQKIVESSWRLPRATLAASTRGTTQPHFLEVNEEDPHSLLGKGAFGRTHVGRLHSVDGRKAERVAVKFPSEKDTSQIDSASFEEEVIKLASIIFLPGGCPHPCLVQLLAYVPERCAIVTELCEGDLQWFRSAGP